MKAAVMVAGSWGTALANVLADNGHRVCLWTRNPDQAEEINREHRNARYLGDAALNPRIAATVSVEEALEEASLVLVAAPTNAMREVAGRMRPHLKENTLVIHAAKGLEERTLKTMSEVLADELPQIDPLGIGVLSGPSHAEEVVIRCPTTIVVAARRIAAAEDAQDALSNGYFRVYTNPDVVGAEIAGSLKNVIALAAGLSDGLGFGDNAKAALITRGLAEIARIGKVLGANPLTFAGLSGVGDLVVTCTSRHSRNYRAGYAVGQGKTLEAVLADMGMVVEGVKTTRAAVNLSERHNVDMPIARQLYSVLFEGKSPRAAVESLMGRVPTHELEEIARTSSGKWID
jgi:glycerol-3-phosphate dehydrogenase (NAD(P)+)